MKTKDFPSAKKMLFITNMDKKKEKERLQRLVLRKIKGSARRGYTALEFDMISLNLRTRTFLEDRGYSVERNKKNPGMRTSHTITWG